MANLGCRKAVHSLLVPSLTHLEQNMICIEANPGLPSALAKAATWASVDFVLVVLVPVVPALSAKTPWVSKFRGSHRAILCSAFV